MPIPVLTSEPEETQADPTAEDTAIPTISVTKPPAPMPVDLPTEHDIVPVDSLYTRGDREEDLEAGEGMMMQEIEHKVEIVTVSRTPPLPTPPTLVNSEFTEDAVLVPLPDRGESPSPTSSVEHVGDVDLLSDEGIVLQAPVPNAKSSDHGHSSSSGSVPEELIKDSENSEEDPPPENTIRLVGGGGMQGTTEETTVEEQPEPEEDHDLVEVEPVEPVALIEPKKVKKGKHKKEKSSVSKVLKRKKGSINNATATAV